MLVSQLSVLATAASAAAIQRRAASITPVFEVSDFTAQHNPHGPDETIQFTVASANTGLESTDCGIYGYQCQHTDFLLCDIPVIGECTNKNVTFSFNKDTKSEKWGIVISYQAPTRFYSAEHQFHRRQDTFYEYDEQEYEHIKVPGGAFSFSNVPTHASKSKRQGSHLEYQITDFVARHNPKGPYETIKFNLEAPASKQGVAPLKTHCAIKDFPCQHTDNYLCDVPVSNFENKCENEKVTFEFTSDEQDDDFNEFVLVINDKTGDEPITSRHVFPKSQEAYYEKDGQKYEYIKVPGRTFNIYAGGTVDRRV